MSEALMVFSTCATREQAERIARSLVEERLAACVQLVPGLQSFYRWQGAVETADEILLFIKSTSQQFPDLKRRIAELHSYDVPEVLAVRVAGGSEKYLAWLHNETRAD